jgi:molybdopterin-guanine dinucleotide biosynthesis protein A
MTGIVLAGGMSRRMGRDKALLTVGGETLLARVATRIRPVVAEVIIVGPASRQEQVPWARVVSDIYPAGPLSGIATGLRAASHPYAFVAACDMPYLNGALIDYLLHLAKQEQSDAVVPKLTGRPEPLHAVYGRTALPTIEAHLTSRRSEDLKVHLTFNDMQVRWVEEPELRRFDPDLLSFRNINTPADWEQYLSIDEQ